MIILSTNVPYFLSYCFIVFKTSASRNISFKLFWTIVNHFIGIIQSRLSEHYKILPSMYAFLIFCSPCDHVDISKCIFTCIHDNFYIFNTQQPMQ